MSNKYLIFIIGIFLISFVSAAPQISNVSIEPEIPLVSDTIQICANVIDDSEISIVRINLRREEPLWNWGLVMDKENNKYCRILSPSLMRVWEISEDKTISYYISARNNLGELKTTETYYFSYRAEPYCGDGYCEGNEDYSSCSVDCGALPPEPDEEYNLSSFDDLDTCKSGVVGDLDLELRDPDEGDNFEVGDEIEVKVRVENNADEDKDIVVEIALYNVDEDDIEEETDDEKEVKNGRDRSFELVLGVPDDFEGDDYLVFVKAYEDDDESSQCVEGAISIDLEREKHDVVIEEFSINPSSIIAGKSFDVFTEVKNIGESDEDVYVVVEIKELGVLTEGETFELEEFGEDDFYSGSLFVKIPKDAKKGEYEITIKAIFDGEEDERKETITVLEREPIQMETIFLNKKITEIKAEEPPKIEKKESLILEKKPPKIEKKERESMIPLFVPWLLFAGIIVLIILIVVGVRRGY